MLCMLSKGRECLEWSFLDLPRPQAEKKTSSNISTDMQPPLLILSIDITILYTKKLRDSANMSIPRVRMSTALIPCTVLVFLSIAPAKHLLRKHTNSKHYEPQRSDDNSPVSEDATDTNETNKSHKSHEAKEQR